MNVTPLRPKPTIELKASSLSTLVPSPIQPSPSLSLPPGMYYIVLDRNNPNMKFFHYPQNGKFIAIHFVYLRFR